MTARKPNAVLGRPPIEDRGEVVVTRTVSGKARHHDALQAWADAEHGGVRAQAFAALIEAEIARRRRAAARARSRGRS